MGSEVKVTNNICPKTHFAGGGILIDGCLWKTILFVVVIAVVVMKKKKS